MRVQDQRISERRRASNKRTLINLYNEAAAHGMTKDDLREFGVPEEFERAVLEECQAIHDLFKTGAQGAARQRANQAALMALETFGDELNPQLREPDELVAQARGEDPNDENHPDALANRVPYGF